LSDLQTKSARKRLAVRREPYWQRLVEGAYLGFRRGPDTWLARYRKPGIKVKPGRSDGPRPEQEYKTLGEALEYDEAKRRAEEWLEQLAGSPVRTVKRDTIKAALESYLADLRQNGRVDAAKEAEWRFKKTVYTDPLADTSLEHATKEDFRDWRERQKAGRQPRSLNRHVRSVVAALNYAVKEAGHVGNPMAWRLKRLADDVEDDGETAVFLTPEQRKALVAAATPFAAAFLRGLELSGARPQELAAATVGHFDGEQLRLAHRKGKPLKLRVRHTVLGPEGIAFFESQTADKPSDALIFTEDGEQQWRRHMWARTVRAAIKAHNKKAKGRERLPVGVGAYAMRHARISELLQIHSVDPLTVALQTGTSVAMIEKAYLRFIPSAMREKLAGVKES
jgi:integrase